MQEFTIGEHTFRMGGLAPRKAFHVSRRIAPVLASLKDLIPLAAGTQPDLDDPEALATLLKPIASALAQMPEADADYVLSACLSTVKVKIDGERGWADLQVGDQMMFAWVTMPLMLQLVWRVMEENLSGFFPVASQAG